jgi:putative GTP pyrophosphokinase
VATTTTGPPYSKTQVNRAGRLRADFIRDYRKEGDDLLASGEWDLRKVFEAAEIIAWWRSLHSSPLVNVNASLRHYVKTYGPVNVTQRLKRRPTIVDKLTREPTMNLTQMGDIGGVRAVVPTIEDIYTVSRRLRKNWDIERVRDYIKDPKPSGYRAMHLIVKRKGYRIEVQLRTPNQDEWANGVEEDSRRLRIGLKSGFGPRAVHDFYVAFAEWLALEDRGQPVDDDLRESVQKLYERAQPFLEPAV